MASLNAGTRSKDYYCGLIYSELKKEQPLKETVLLTRLEQQNVLAVDVRECLMLMEENGSICKTAARENIWQLLPELHSHDTDRGDFAHSLGQSVAQTERDIDPESIRRTYSLDCGTLIALAEVFKSIGFITGEKGSGTCFRVGNDKIITAAHVVKDNIWDTVLNRCYEEDLKSFEVDFNFISVRSSIFFKVEPKVLFMNESLDIAVLQLKPDDQMPFPPPLEKIYRLNPIKDEDKEIFLIGHNKGKSKKINAGIGIWNPTEERLKDLEKCCKKYGQENGYKDVDRKDRLVIQCEFVGGASGSPGIVFYKDVAHVVCVYIRGFPSFYYSQQFPDEARRSFPINKLLQQGVNIGDLFDTMSSNKEYLELCNEIFPEQAKKQLQHKQSSQNNEKGGKDKCTVDDLSAGMGNISLESSTNEDTVPKSCLSIEKNLKKIISLFVEPNMNLKPKDVAQKCGIGQSRKAVNKLLYYLEKKKVLTVTTSDGKDPKWNKGSLTQYSNRDLQKWAAEIEYGSTRFPAPTPALDPINQEERRGKEVMPASDDIVSNLQQNSQ